MVAVSYLASGAQGIQGIQGIPGIPGSGGGLSQSEVDARVTAGVLDEAEESNSDAWAIVKGGTGQTDAAAALTALGGLTSSEVDGRAAARFTTTEKSKLLEIEEDATEDQTAAEIVALLATLSDTNRLTGAAIQLIASAIDTELGSSTWRTGGGGGGGLTESQVDARVDARVHDEAEETNSDAWGIAKGGTGQTAAAGALGALGGLTESEVDTRAATRYTTTEKAKLLAIEGDATEDQTGAEIVALLAALTDTARLSGSAVQLIAGALDTELGSSTWRTGGGGGGGLSESDVDARVAVGVLDEAETANVAAWGVAKGGTGETDAAAALTALGGLTESEVDTRAATRFTTEEKAKLLAIEGDATEDQTAAEILTALLTVDGADSGLDADLLDGNTPAQVAALNTGLSASSVNTLADARIAVKLAEAVNGNTETGITVTYGSDGTLDFAVGVPTQPLRTGWSANASITGTEILAGASATSDRVTIPTATGAQYLFVWRANDDDGDPDELFLAGAGVRNLFGAAVSRTVDSIGGRLMVSHTTQNAALLSGEMLRAV